MKLSILMTSDTHGFWLETPKKPHSSLLNTAGTIRHLRHSLNHPVLTIDLGDFIQGSSFATYCKQEIRDGSVFARAMNQIGYDAQLIGNHEFNFGKDYRDHILNQIEAPIVCANIVWEATGEVALGVPYIIKEVEGAKVGIIGVTTEYIPHWELPAHYEGLAFRDACEVAKHYAQILRPQVDVLVVAYHGGFERDLVSGEPLEALTGENRGAQMLAEIPEMDVLLTGHQHRVLCQQVGNTWIVQPGFAGEYVAQVTVTLENRKVTKLTGELHEVSHFVPSDEVAQVMSPELENGRAWLKEVLGKAPLLQVTQDDFMARLYGHPYIQFLNELQLRETGAQYSAVALVNPAFRAFHGEITNEILLNSYPYYNLMARVSVTGAELKEALEFDLHYLILDEKGKMAINPSYIDPKPKHYNFDLYTGFRTVVDMSQPLGKRVVAMVDEASGEALRMDQVYTLALSQYRACGGGDYTMFKPEKMEYLSTVDIATRMKEALRQFTTEDWQAINENYCHFEWI